jgi:hypothetical protein
MKDSSKVAMQVVTSLGLWLAVVTAFAQPFGMGPGMMRGMEPGSMMGGNGSEHFHITADAG